jgi:uncharacterized protein YecE (DUF72 family)
MARSRVHIGTSGWHYRHWVGPFYPEGTDASGMLVTYAHSFDTVEINNTFYNLPDRRTVRGWRDDVPRGFRFACKASRYITHMKKLKDPSKSIRRFFRAIDPLGAYLGPILFQLPPHWHRDVDRLAAFLDVLPSGHRYAFELRDPDWFADEVVQVLADHKAAFCLYELAGRKSPVIVTTDFVYARLHGPGRAYQGEYDGRTLHGWARRMERWLGDGRDVWCYFDNDQRGYAAIDALRLQEMISRGD